MASRKPNLKVIVSQTALNELKVIWGYNVAAYGVDWANRYNAFLERQIQALGVTYELSRYLASFPGLRYEVIKRRSKGDGHVAIFEISESEALLTVLHVFHTKMDIPSRLAGDHSQ